jgi:hypothetical protein
MLPDFIEPKTLWIILHLFGVVVAMGGACASDLMFFASIKDEMFSATEAKFIRLGSRMVWCGIALILLSGAGLFLLNPDQYMQSTKFLSKMSIVFIVLANGIVFHKIHLPLIERHIGKVYGMSEEFIKRKKFLAMSGAISMTSWSWTLALGVFKALPFSYVQIMSVYAFTLFGAMFIAGALAERLIPSARQEK